MENLYLGSDESISLTTQSVVVDGIRHEAILTNKRLILIRSDAPATGHTEIPLSSISSAIAGENPLREPTITLVIAAPDGVLTTVQMVFIRLVSEQKNPQFDDWVNRLKSCIKVTVAEPETTCTGPSAIQLPHEKVTPAELQVPANTTDSCGTPQVPSYVFRPPKPALPPDAKNETFPKVLALVLVIAAVAIGAVFAAQFMLPKAPAGTSADGAPAATTAGTIPPTTIATPEPATPVTTAPVSAPEATGVIVPQTGVWVRVEYPNNYIGSVGTQGRLREINTTGDHFFQIPAKNEVVIADITKVDAGGAPITVEVYNGGILVKRVSKTTPHANILINVAL